MGRDKNELETPILRQGRRASAADKTVQIGNNDENLSNFSLSNPSADVKHETSLRKEVAKSHMPLSPNRNIHIFGHNIETAHF